MMILQQTRGNLSSGDQLALDLQFALDKTITARIGPTPNFTRASTGTFVGSNGLIQTAAVNAARFDHDPVTLASRGLLIEESRTNLARFSEGLTTGWNLYNGATKATNSSTAPNGLNSASLISFSALANSAIEQEILSQPAGSYTYSLYMRADSPTTVRIGNGAPTLNCSVTTAWQRFTITFTTTSNGTLFPLIYNSGVGGAKSFYVWGAQVEAGSFASSYIPTTSASVVRSADVCSISGGDFSTMYNNTEGTLFANVIPRSEDQRAAVLCCNTTTSSNLNWILKSATTIANAGKRWTGQTGAVSVITTTSDVAVSQSKLAYGYKSDDYAFAYNNAIVRTGTSGAVTSPTIMRIGHRDDGLYINGHLSAIRYYRRRLSNAKTQALTV